MSRDPGRDEYDKSRVWLERSATAIIAGYAILIVAVLFRPLLPLVIVALLAVLFGIGMFFWHVQRSSWLRRDMPAMRRARWPIRTVATYPVVCGVVGAAAVVVAGVELVKLLKGA